MKKVFTLITTALLIMSLSTFTAFANPGNGNGQGNAFGHGNGNGQGDGNGHKVMKEFKDMNGHWGSKSVHKIQSAGIIEGYSDDTFQPDKAITEAELAVIIDRLLDARLGDDDDSATGDDESTDDEELSGVPKWAKNAVSKGFEKRYLNQKRFHSHVQCNRLMACVAIAKALGLEPVTDYTNNPFTDWKLISGEDYGYLLALYEAGYINGYPDGNFNPKHLITRVQIAAIIEKLLGEELLSDDETAPSWDSDSEVTAEDIRATSVILEWSGAEDDVKVVGYKVCCEIDDVDKVKYVSGTTAAIGGLEPETEYTFTVEAKDAAGNWSDDGPSVTIITLEEEAPDTSAPTWPSDATLTVSASESGIVTIVWPDAEDNVGVAAYKVYKNGHLIKTLDGDANNVNITGLNADTEYTFKVRAEDKAGNLSTSLSKTYLTD